MRIFSFRLLSFVLLGTFALISCNEKEVTYSNKLTLGSSNVDQLLDPQGLDYDAAKTQIEKRLKTIGLDEFKVELVGEKKDKIEISYNGEITDEMLELLLSPPVEIGFYATYDFFEILEALSAETINKYLQLKLQLENPNLEVDSLYLAENFQYASEKYFPAIVIGKQDFSKHEAIFAYATVQDTSRVDDALMDSTIDGAVSDLHDLIWVWVMKPIKFPKGKEPVLPLYALKMPFDEESIITGKHIQLAEVINDNKTGNPVLSIELTEKGKELLENLTAENYNKQIAIAVYDQVIQAPYVNNTITSGKLWVSGAYTREELKALADLLNHAYLPFELDIVPNEE